MLGLTFENVYIKSKDSTRLHMFFVKQPTEALAASAPTILYFHGNAGNIGHRLMNVKGLVQLLGCNVCLLEYRGYGHSDGSPNEEGFYLDAQAALDYLVGRPDIDQRKIVVFGRSLGENGELNYFLFKFSLLEHFQIEGAPFKDWLDSSACESIEHILIILKYFFRWSCCYRFGIQSREQYTHRMSACGEHLYKYSWCGQSSLQLSDYSILAPLVL